MEIEYSDDTLCVGADGALLVLCWWNAPTREQMLVIDRISAAREEQLKGKTAYVQFVLEGTPIFTPEVRAIAERITRDYYGVGIAHCIELPGLKGSATRAFLGGLLLIRGARGEKPMKVFGDPQAASKWLAGHLSAAEANWGAARILALREALILAHHEG
ncbi:MAG: hypothetical protein AB8H86_33460 [Polyangiales bacterium]